VFHNKFTEAEPECHDFSIGRIQCDPKFMIKMFLLPVISRMGRRIRDFERHEGQSSENEKKVDFPLFITPDMITAMLKYPFMKGCPVAVDLVIVLDDKKKW
jgi:hypothetical protein